MRDFLCVPNEVVKIILTLKMSNFFFLFCFIVGPDEVHGFEEEDTIIYEPLPHAFVTLAVFLSSTNAKDILETKWSGGKTMFFL